MRRPGDHREHSSDDTLCSLSSCGIEIATGTLCREQLAIWESHCVILGAPCPACAWPVAAQQSMTSDLLDLPDERRQMIGLPLREQTLKVKFLAQEIPMASAILESREKVIKFPLMGRFWGPQIQIQPPSLA